MMKLIDKDFTLTMSDLLFKTANFEHKVHDTNSDATLNRFEFIEIIIRIAKFKYIEFGTETNLASALGILLWVNFFPVINDYASVAIFREQKLWCQDVNDVLEVNIRPIRKLYDFIAKHDF